MLVLGLETSCDETGVALYDSTDGLLAHALYSQIAMHAEYGGVVPELASRDHVRRLVPLAREVLGRAGRTLADLGGVAYTAGPGLVGALLTGASVGRSLAFALQVPAVAVHHMEGHLLAPMLEPNPPGFPFLALLVSGGHTMLVDVVGVGRYRVIGETLDDAAGEAFDKVATLLGLPYPGGPPLAVLAQDGDPSRFRFPRPMLDRPGFDFSFSGLKTAVLHALHALEGVANEATRASVARGFEEAVVETLCTKCERALLETGRGALVVSGGVGANRRLRANLRVTVERLARRVHFPRLELCTDNGAMIAYAGWLRLRAGAFEQLSFAATPRWSLETLGAVDEGDGANGRST